MAAAAHVIPGAAVEGVPSLTADACGAEAMPDHVACGTETVCAAARDRTRGLFEATISA